MANPQQHHVTVESIQDEDAVQNKSQAQEISLAQEDQGSAPSDQYTAWREVDEAEEQARQERQQPGEAAQERKNATQAAHIIEDYIHQHKN